jgi:hypothetical protein|nr:MAG TPA: hypothetical protein [Caudoviricetes sp.]
MAIRIQQYNTGPRRIGVGGIDPGYQQPRIGNIAATAENQLAGTVLDAGKALTNVAIKEYVSTETTRVSQSLLAMQKELSAERDRYMAENQGQNAIEAGQHFEKFARETAQKYFQEGGFSGRFAEMFNKQAAGTTLHFTEQGQAYGRQQKASWEESVLTGEIEDFQNLAAQNYNNPELIEFNRSALRERIENMRPGMDNRALLSRIDEGAAESIISGYLAHDDIKGARGALNEYRGLLGDKVNAVELQIRNRADALEAKARAEAERAQREAEKRLVSGTVSEILSGVSDYPSLEEQREAAFAQVDLIADPTVRDKVRTEIRQEMSWKKDMEDATVSREVRQYQELARREGWTPRQASENVNHAEISDKAKEKLFKDYDGRAEKVTPKNKAALDELRRQIDLGAERGGIDRNDSDKIDAFIERHALTYEQAKAAHQYAEQGGAAGKLTQTHLNQAYKILFPKKKPATMPADLFDLVASELEPGKPVTDAQVRKIIARLYTDGSGWFSESYADALRKGKGTQWAPDIDVPESERRRIEMILRDNGITATNDRIKRYYWDELGGEI